MNGQDLISKRTRTAFRELLVGWKLREIKDAFSAEGLEPDLTFDPMLEGERRRLVEQYYHTIDFTKRTDTNRMLHVYEAILADCSAHLATPGMSSNLKMEYEKLIGCLGRDGYEYIDGRLRPTGRLAILRHLSSTAEKLDAEYLAAQVTRLSDAVEQYPDLAIGQAKELVETCCKTILTDAGDSGIDNLDMVGLVKRTMTHLQLLPTDIPDSAKGSRTIRTVLQNLATISQGMAELRNLYGTGHGKHAGHKQLPVRHARLAVGAATTLASFLFDTHAERMASDESEKNEENQAV